MRTVFTAIVGSLALYAHANPANVASVLIDVIPSANRLDEHADLIVAARQRIADL